MVVSDYQYLCLWFPKPYIYHMKYNKILVGLLALGMLGQVQAQTTTLEKSNPNQIKINLFPLLGNKISIEYERRLSKHMSIGAAVSLRPEAKLPLASTISDYIDDERLTPLIGGFRSANYSVVPELRFYTSSKGNMSGFYIAPYVKYTSHDVLVPYHFDYEINYKGKTLYDREEDIQLEGSVKSYTAGVSIGVNYKLSKHLMLDWRIIGPGYGFMDGQIAGKAMLSDVEQVGLSHELDELSESLRDMPLGIDVDYEVNDEGVNFNINNSPWATVRTGLSISYSF